jgi:2-polyprenyl-6-methoxyphenol hydroxylase-like FAD-dependent oxidoreductase
MTTDICIRGAGAVGKVLALLLARARIRVGLVQRDMPAHQQEDIRSYALNAASRRLLQSLRVWPDLACPVQHMRVRGDAGSQQEGQVNFDAPQGSEALAWIVDAAELGRKLSAAVSFAPEIQLLSQASPAQLTVICEGKLSQTRQEHGISFEQFSYGQTALAAHLDCELSHDNTAWQWMRSGEVCALLPRQDAQSAAGNSVALVWSVSHERATSLLALSPEDVSKELHIATQGRLGLLQVKSRIAAWPLSVAQAQQWCGSSAEGAWVLVGDSAHAIHPLAGQGLNLGLQDAQELADTLTHKPYFRGFGDARLLRAYERSRKADAAQLRLATDGLQQLFAASDPRVQALRAWGMSSFDAAAPLKRWLMAQASGARSAN